MKGGFMKKKTIVITGGASGIGYEIAKLFCKKNYNVVVIDNNSKLIYTIKNDKNKICYYCASVCNENDICYVMKKISEKFGSIDILVNNAAKQVVASLDDSTFESFRDVIDTNLNGTFLCIKESLKYMEKNSTILNIISVHYEKPRVNKYSYDASKAGIALLTKELALELANKEISINALSFGAVATPLNNDWINNLEIVEQTRKKIPLKKIFEPNEIAGFVYNILVNFSRYTTGSIFTIDAGRSLV